MSDHTKPEYYVTNNNNLTGINPSSITSTASMIAAQERHTQEVFIKLIQDYIHDNLYLDCIFDRPNNSYNISLRDTSWGGAIKTCNIDLNEVI